MRNNFEIKIYKISVYLMIVSYIIVLYVIITGNHTWNFWSIATLIIGLILIIYFGIRVRIMERNKNG